MSSLMQERSSGSGEEQEPMSMQQRVIQSGLDSIKGRDAPKIVQLFKSLAVFAVHYLPSIATAPALLREKLSWSFVFHRSIGSP